MTLGTKIPLSRMLFPRSLRDPPASSYAVNSRSHGSSASKEERATTSTFFSSGRSFASVAVSRHIGHGLRPFCHSCGLFSALARCRVIPAAARAAPAWKNKRLLAFMVRSSILGCILFVERHVFLNYLFHASKRIPSTLSFPRRGNWICGPSAWSWRSSDRILSVVVQALCRAFANGCGHGVCLQRIVWRHPPVCSCVELGLLVL